MVFHNSHSRNAVKFFLILLLDLHVKMLYLVKYLHLRHPLVHLMHKKLFYQEEHSQFNQIGERVPPLLSKAIAQQVLQKLP
jgi:hypothetical protein